MRILAFSDVPKWVGYDELVYKVRPDVVALAGDLTSDGFAAFWDEAAEQIPEFQSEKKLLMNKFNISQRSNGLYLGRNMSRFLNELESLRSKYRKTEDFRKIRKKLHVDKFYEFLSVAGKNSHVLVVKGDHDEDFEGDYAPEKIDGISGCNEISGKIAEIEDISFLGLGFEQTHYLTTLKPLLMAVGNKTDIIITHCEQNRMQFLISDKVRLIIRGHFGFGRYLVNGIKSAFTSGVYYTLAEIKNNGSVEIKQYVIRRDGQISELSKGSAKPWFSEVSEYERYKWLKPYVE